MSKLVHVLDLNVRPDHIEVGVRCSEAQCPIAHALLEALQAIPGVTNATVRVYAHQVDVWIAAGVDSYRGAIACTKEMRDFIRHFDKPYRAWEVEARPFRQKVAMAFYLYATWGHYVHEATRWHG